MIKPTVSLLDVVEFLNLMVVLDRDAMVKMFDHKVAVDSQIAYKTAVQCGGKDGKFWMRMLGLINGIFGESGLEEHRGGLAVVYDMIQVGGKKKQVLRGFTLTSEGKEALKKSAGIGRRDARIN